MSLVFLPKARSALHNYFNIYGTISAHYANVPDLIDVGRNDDYFFAHARLKSLTFDPRCKVICIKFPSFAPFQTTRDDHQSFSSILGITTIL